MTATSYRMILPDKVAFIFTICNQAFSASRVIRQSHALQPHGEARVGFEVRQRRGALIEGSFNPSFATFALQALRTIRLNPPPDSFHFEGPVSLSYVALWRSCNSYLQITLKAFNGSSLFSALIRSCSADRLSAPYCLTIRSIDLVRNKRTYCILTKSC